MARYVVKSGDMLSTIAPRFGMEWRELYEHPNNADFRAKRPDPNLIYPGDELWVPGEDESGSVGFRIVEFDPEDDREDDRFQFISPAFFHLGSTMVKYKVNTGDTLANIAEAVGISEEDLKLMNWGTTDETEIAYYLNHYFVSAKPQKKGNIVFSSDDDPGILLLPGEPDPAMLKQARRTVLASRFPVD